MRVLNDEEIYSAVTEGFGRKVKADNLTDEIALKRHEAARMVAKVQFQADVKGFIEWLKTNCWEGGITTKDVVDYLIILEQLVEE